MYIASAQKELANDEIIRLLTLGFKVIHLKVLAATSSVRTSTITMGEIFFWPNFIEDDKKEVNLSLMACIII